MSFLTKCKDICRESLDFHVGSPTAVYKLFIATVLVLFSLLSLVSISTGNAIQDVPVLEKSMASAHFWWGLLGLYGASTLFFEKYVKGSLLTVISGYVSAILSLSLLSYDFLTTKPPIYSGGILAATAVVFLGGLLYGRVKHR